jgi:hypothetical protein
MKLVAKNREQVLIDENPSLINDPVLYNRLKEVVAVEVVHRAWGSALYKLQRLGHLDPKYNPHLSSDELVRAGNKYHQIVLDFQRYEDMDPEEAIPEARDFLYRKIKAGKKKWVGVKKELGLRRKIVDSVILANEWPVFEAQKMEFRQALEDLATFFRLGTKRQQKK